MKCKELMVNDWIANQDETPMPIYSTGSICAYASTGNILWMFENNKYKPQPIPITPEMLEKNGWKETQYWLEYQDGKNTIQCCLPDMRGRINGIEIEHFKCEYVHQYQHLLRLCGLNELADDFKV